MISVRALGILTSDPKRMEIAFCALNNFMTAPLHSDGYGLATFVDDSLLLKRVPGKLAGKGLADLANCLQGRVSLMQLRTEDELKPTLYASSNTNLGPFRLRQFAGIIAGGPQNADEANYYREELLKDIPDFLRHHILGQTESEAFFVRLMSDCYKKNQSDMRCLSASLVIETIQQLIHVLDCRQPRIIMLSSGEEIICFVHGKSSAVLTIDGLSSDTACERSVLFADSSIAKERLRQFRALIFLSGLSETFLKNQTLPEGIKIEPFVEDTCCVLRKEMQTQRLF